MKFETSINGETAEVNLDLSNNRGTVNGEERDFRLVRQKNGRHLLRLDKKLYVIDNIQYEKHEVEFTINGEWSRVTVRDEQDLLLDRLGFKTAAELDEGELKAPMPGKILKLLVEEGDEVELGDPVAILEAMKMENELKAPQAGVISGIAVGEGDSVEKNVLILEIEASG